MEHGRHPPGEVLGTPDPAQAAGGIRIQQLLATAPVPLDERLREQTHVRNREVEPFRSSRRHDVARVAREKEPAVLERLDDEAPHPRDALLEDGPLGELPVPNTQPRLQLDPDSLVRPLVEILVRCALQIEAAQFWRTQAEEREAV